MAFWSRFQSRSKRGDVPPDPPQAPLPSANAVLIVADPTKRATDREEDGESRFVRSARLLAYLLSRSEAKYAVRIEHLHHALRALDILEALDTHLDAWHRTARLLTPEGADGWEPRFLFILCGHGRDGGLETYPDTREICRYGSPCIYCTPGNAIYRASKWATESLLKSMPNAAKHSLTHETLLLDGNDQNFLPYEAIFQLLNRYPGKKAVIIEACQGGSFVPALLKLQPRDLVVVSASGSTELAYGQRLVEFLTTQLRDEAPTDLRRIIDLLPAPLATQKPVVWIASPDGHLLSSKDFPLLKAALPGPRPVPATHDARQTMTVVPFRQEEPPKGDTEGDPNAAPADAAST